MSKYSTHKLSGKPLDDFEDDDVRAAAFASRYMRGQPGAALRHGSTFRRGIEVLHEIGVVNMTVVGPANGSQGDTDVVRIEWRGR